MAYPTAYNSTATVPLPSEQTVQQMCGESYDPVYMLKFLDIETRQP
jgi:hypothetical protein